KAQRLLVDDENVRVEDPRGMLNDLGADLEGLVDTHRQVKGGVLAVAQLYHPGNADEVHPAPEIEAAYDGRAGNDQDGHVLVAFHHGMSQGPASAQMAQAEGVVAVDQHTGSVAARYHVGTPLGSSGGT